MSTVAEVAELPADSTAGAPDGLQSLALAGLRRMYLPDRGLFAFRLRRTEQGDVLEGASGRYTAIALIGLAGRQRQEAARVLGGEETESVCGRLLAHVSEAPNLGDVALALWAARALGHGRTEEARDALGALRPVEGQHPTVELAWALSALTAEEQPSAADADLARGIARRLLASFNPASGLFAHWPADAGRSAPAGQLNTLRGHVTCFADLVYPIQALAHYYERTGESEAIEAAGRCAERMCALQGDAGQWWWHYDVRTGRVVEGYPVYSVHQDAMAPMALFALRDACGADFTRAVRRGLDWLYRPPETSEGLVDPTAGVIWRKVARREPRKLARRLQAGASRIHRSLRVPGVDVFFPPGRIDYECRPYHLGWLLYAWSSKRTDRRVA